MANELIAAALAAWLAAALLALAGRALTAAAALIGLGAAILLAVAITSLPGGTSPVPVPLGIGSAVFRLDPAGLWLMGFGLPAAGLAVGLGSPVARRGPWLLGAALSLIGALGVFGLQDAASFLIAWEVMSLGGAVMLLAERSGAESGRSVLFMLGLLEVGAVALLVGFIWLSAHAGDTGFAGFAAQAQAAGAVPGFAIAVLLLVGFGAKLGLLPFYEWFPGAYGNGSGASGAILSGIVLNAAFFGLGRGLLHWLPASALPVSPPGMLLVAVGVASAILTALYAFQQEGWRELLALSSAENGAIAASLLGAALMFRQDGLADLAGLAWTVALIHLAGHALAKGALFLAADGVRRATGSYAIMQRGLLGRSAAVFGLGALFAAMSLAAMPPQAGFVSEWYLFQTFFQGFRLASLASRLTAALAGAGLALTAAIAFATFVKVFGIGLLGQGDPAARRVPAPNAAAVGTLGGLVLALAVGMPVWLDGLSGAVPFATDAVARMHEGWLLVPLTSSFAFISPSRLVIAMPLLALLPLALLRLSVPRWPRRVPVWYGGGWPDPLRAATTALSFSNALRTFYGFIYRPTATTEREVAHEGNGQPYFVRRLAFSHDVAPVFGPYVFAPLEHAVVAMAKRLRIIQSGRLNVYLALIGLLLVLILIVGLF